MAMIDMDLIRRLTNRDIRQMYRKVMKMQEEAGEAAAAFLEFDGSPNVSASAKSDDPRHDLFEESVDTILCGMDVIVSLGYSDEEIEAEFDRKLAKWKSKVEKHRALPAE
jgi:hypothetical protein